MSNIISFPKTTLSDDIILEVKKFQIAINKLWEKYSKDNEILDYERELKNCFDKTMRKMQKGYLWDENQIEAYFEEVTHFPDDEEDLLFVVLSFTTITEVYPDILNKEVLETEEIISILLDFECYFDEYLPMIKLYFSNNVNRFWKENPCTSFQKQLIFENAIEDIEDIPTESEITHYLKQSHTYALINNTAKILEKSFLNINQLYHNVLSDIEILKLISIDNFSEVFGGDFSGILRIKRLPLEEQSSYLTEIYELDQKEIPYTKKLHILLEITNTFLQNNNITPKKKRITLNI